MNKLTNITEWKRAIKDGRIVLIDSREQLPYRFEFLNKYESSMWNCAVLGLDTGDYSVVMADLYEPSKTSDQIVIERKSLQDLYQSVTRGRRRFEAEFARMASYGYAALVIEADWPAIMQPNEHLRRPTSVSPKSVARTILAWSQRYKVHVFTCPDRDFAEQLTFRLLERWWLDHRPQGKAKPQDN